jgi:hypothetical protein
MCRRPYLIKFNRTLADGTAECACYLVWVRTAQRSVPASAPLKAFNQLGVSPDQGNVTALYPTVVTAFP